jgi:hypothetical protein
MKTTASAARGRDRRQSAGDPDRMAGTAPERAHDEFPRGAVDPHRVRAPGNLTGDYPHARDRAERCRERTR